MKRNASCLVISSLTHTHTERKGDEYRVVKELQNLGVGEGLKEEKELSETMFNLLSYALAHFHL